MRKSSSRGPASTLQEAMDGSLPNQESGRPHVSAPSVCESSQNGTRSQPGWSQHPLSPSLRRNSTPTGPTSCIPYPNPTEDAYTRIRARRERDPQAMMCLKLASYSYSISASITDFAQNVFTGQIDHAEFESVVRFDFEGDLQGQIQGQRTGNAL